jgi:repressor LexA
VFAYVRARLLAGSPPTVREVQRALGFRAAQTARQHLEALVAEGQLVVERGVSRGYRLPPAAGAGIPAGVLGVMHAGARIERPAARSMSSGVRPAKSGAPAFESLAKPAARRGSATPSPPLRARTWVPLLGRVQAGALTFATEDLEGYVPLEAGESVAPDDMAAQEAQAARIEAPGALGEHFALRVVGESMTGAGIMPGDIVIVRRQARARAGEIVVAQVGDEATVKRLRLRKGRVELWAEHPDFAPIVPDGDVAILGRVVEVRRRY